MNPGALLLIFSHSSALAFYSFFPFFSFFSLCTALAPTPTLATLHPHLHFCRLSPPHLLLSFANANNLPFTLTPSTTPASQFLDPLQPLLFHNHTHTHTFSLRPIPFSSSSSSHPPSTNTNTPSNNDSLVVNHFVRSSGSSGLVSLSNSRRPGEQAPVCTHPHALQDLHQPLYPERQHYPQLRCRSALAPLCLQVR